MLFLLLWWYIYFFFFFQAEDGIRDLIVTGVQTCALPISRRRGDADEVVLRDGDHLARAVELGHNRRRVPRAVAVPLPLHGAGGRVERRERALVVAADVQDHQPAIDERRHGRPVQRPDRRRRLLPELLAGRRIEGGDDAAHAEGEELAS